MLHLACCVLVCVCRAQLQLPDSELSRKDFLVLESLPREKLGVGDR